LKLFIDFPHSPACAPSILITFINMVLFKDADELKNCNTIYMFAGQVTKFLNALSLNTSNKNYIKFLSEYYI